MASLNKGSRAKDTQQTAAWIFQFTAESSRNWLRKVKVGDVQEWRASRFGAQMRPDSIAFFWMAGVKGGLFGWGRITEVRPKFKDAKIEIGGWMEEPAPRDEVFSANAIGPDNLLRRNPQATNFPLSHAEAIALCSRVPNSSRARALLATPETGAEASTSALDRSIRDRLKSLGVERATPEAQELLRRAASYVVGKSGTGHVTSTRLLFALADSEGFSGRDGVAALAMRKAFASEPELAKGMASLRDAYRKEQPFSTSTPRGIGFTPNISKMIRTAAAIAAEVFLEPRTLMVNALVAVLLGGVGNVRRRAARSGLDFERLAQAVNQCFASEVDADRHEVSVRMAAGMQAREPDPASPRPDEPKPDQPPPEPPSPDTAAPELPTADPETFAGIGFAALGNDDPWSGELQDQLGALGEAQAFARAAAAKSFDPPLAFGIFGTWGSGKSYFMRLIHHHVDQLTSGKAPEAATGQFHADIIQIRFNAWHYVDQNLWASLVDHIFSEIDSWVRVNSGGRDPLLDRLVTAREMTLDAALQLRARRSEERAAQSQLLEAEKVLSEARAKVGQQPGIVWDAFKAAFSEEIEKEGSELLEASDALGLKGAVSSAESFRRVSTELASEAGQVRAILRALAARFTTGRSVAIFVGVVAATELLGAGVVLLGKASIPYLSEFAGGLNAIVLQGAAFFGAAALLMKGAVSKARASVAVIESCRDRFEQRVEERVQQEKEAAGAADRTLSELVEEVAAARTQLAEAAAQLAAASREFSEEDGHSRLTRFIRTRTGDAGYGKHLGLVAAIRKDFAELSTLVSGTRSELADTLELQSKDYRKRVEALIAENKNEGLLTGPEVASLQQTMRKPAGDARKFSRVVLYIDDLDRCPPERVVAVLQAVHLLLTFPIFVIFVAVDMRWIGRSLEQHYGSLLDADGRTSANGAAATALDYIEKIFQVPYKVRPLDPMSSSMFLQFRAGASVAAVPGDAARVEAGASDRIPEENPPKDKDDMPATDPPVTDPLGPTDDSPGESEDPEDDVTATAIALTPEEHAFMTRIAQCAGDTPRRTLRFLNAYRVIKAGLDRENLRTLERSGGYRALMIELALATALPACLPILGRVLWSDTPEAGLKALLQRRPVSGEKPEHIEAVAAALTVLLDDRTETTSPKSPAGTEAAIAAAVAPLRHYVGVAARYTFG